MDIYELQDKIGDELLDKTADSLDAVLMEAYYLGKLDGAREAMDVSQYVKEDEAPEPDSGCGDYECEFCYPQDAPTVYDEGCGDADCSYCYPQAEEGEDISDALLAALDALAEPDDTVYVMIGDGVQIPLDTFVDLLAADLNDLEARLDKMTERIEACEYEAGVKYVG